MIAMPRALRSGSLLGITTVGLTVVSTLVLIALRSSQARVFETAYLINVLTYAVAAFLAVRTTGRIELATLDAVVAATWAGALGTVLQGALLGSLDSGILVAVVVMLIIEWVTAAMVAPLCGWLGYLSRRLVPVRGQSAADPRAPTMATEHDAPAAQGVEGLSTH
jgi:hypothetical protein